MKYLLKNGTVVSGDLSVREDVLIDGETIVKTGQNLEEHPPVNIVTEIIQAPS